LEGFDASWTREGELELRGSEVWYVARSDKGGLGPHHDVEQRDGCCGVAVHWTSREVPYAVINEQVLLIRRRLVWFEGLFGTAVAPTRGFEMGLRKVRCVRMSATFEGYAYGCRISL
jgi:hypothetical protein